MLNNLHAGLVESNKPDRVIVGWCICVCVWGGAHNYKIKTLMLTFGYNTILGYIDTNYVLNTWYCCLDRQRVLSKSWYLLEYIAIIDQSIVV